MCAETSGQSQKIMSSGPSGLSEGISAASRSTTSSNLLGHRRALMPMTLFASCELKRVCLEDYLAKSAPDKRS